MEQIKQEVCGNFGPNAAKVTAPEKLEKLAASLRKAADAAEKAVGPAKSFYAQLDDKQKARVEEVSERRRMAHRGDRDGRGWGRGGPGYGGPGQGGPGQGGPGSGQGPWAPGGPFHPGSQQ
jgi:hypothetical protein